MSECVRATDLTLAVAAAIDDASEYDMQQTQGGEVREALANAVKVIERHVPPSDARTTAIRKIREVRMVLMAASFR